MKQIIEKLTLDASLGGTQAALYMKRSDTGSRLVSITVSSKGGKYSLLPTMSAVIYAYKPDGTRVCADCEIIENNILFSIPTQLISLAGTVLCELVLYDNNMNQLTTPRFEIIVEDTLYDENAIESTDEYSALISALATANKLSNVSVEVDTLEPQQMATGSAVITTDGVEFTFGIPKGEKGEKGAAGEGAGDMHTSIYDTNGRSTDIFKYIDAHKNDENNPHGITASQVGADALGSAAAVNAKTDGHIADKENPHGVTAEQIGAALSSTTVNGKALDTNIELTATDLGLKKLSGSVTVSGSAWGGGSGTITFSEPFNQIPVVNLYPSVRSMTAITNLTETGFSFNIARDGAFSNENLGWSAIGV